MADEEEDLEVSEEEESEEGTGKKKLPGRTLILFIVLPLIAVGAIGIGLLTFLGGDDEVDHDALAEVTPRLQDPTEVNFLDIEELLVNIRTLDQRSTFLSLKVSLEINKDQDLEKLATAMPRIRDKFQVYLRELRLEDLAGAAGTQRVKEELLRRVNIAASPVRVNAVLIREMVVQ